MRTTRSTSPFVTGSEGRRSSRTRPQTSQIRTSRSHNRERATTHKHPKQSNNGLLARVLRIQIPDIPEPCEVHTECGLRSTGRCPAKRSKYRATAERGDAHVLREGGGEAIEDHGAVVEDVRGEAVHLRFGFEGGAETPGEEDSWSG